MLPILFAFLAYISWAVGDIVSVHLSRKLSTWSMGFWGYILRLGLYTLAIPLFTNDLHGLTPTIAVYALLVGLSTVLGQLCFYKAVRLTNPALAGTITGSWGATSILYSLIFLHEQPTMLQFVAIGVIFSGIAISIVQLLRNENILSIRLIQDRGVWWALAGAALWGICGSFIKIPIAHIGWFWSTYALVLPFGFITLYRLILQRKLPENPKKQHLTFPLIFYAFLLVLAESSYNIGIQLGHVAVVAAIAGSYSSLYAVLAFIIFREPLTRQQKIGIIITILGIVALSFLSV